MNILIKNIPNTYNYGSMMMAENLITYLNKNIKDVNYYTEAATKGDLERLRTATGYENVYKDEVFNIKIVLDVKLIRYFERRYKMSKASKKKVKFYDAVIVLGGDDYSEFYHVFPKDNQHIVNLFKDLQSINKATNLFMIGQTIGPYSGDRINMAKDGFRNIKIYSREDVTPIYMKEKLGIDIKTTRDLAFLDLNLQEDYIKNKKDILNKYKLKENKYISIVGTGLFSSYSDDKELFLKKFKEIIEIARNKNKDKEILWLSHVVTPDHVNDNNFLEELKKIDAKFVKSLKVITEPILPAEARVILGSGYYTIGCRMHSCVNTFQMGKPAICLAYGPKYEGVIGKGLDMAELVVPADGTEFWKKTVIKEVTQKIDYINENYEEIVSKIKKNVVKSKKYVEKMFSEITEDIKGFNEN